MSPRSMRLLLINRATPLRAWHFVRSLPLHRPQLWPLAVNDWIAALALRDYFMRHVGPPA